MSRVPTGRSSPEYSESERSAQEDIDYTQNSELYFATITKLQKHAIKVRQHDIDQEKKLIEYLPVNEKFNLNKEGKVLTRWQERQRDWERIQASISRKISGKDTRPLMMTTTDEYRAKIEEYDLIQAALPLKDRYSDSSWQMTLRGGGPVCIAIGHIFSGIECKFDVEVPRPKMIRKPKPPEATFKNDTFLENTEALTKKRKKYEKSITEIRPHNLTFREAGNLVVKSSNLFAWAKESSTRYFQEKAENELAVIREEEQANQSVASADIRSIHSIGSSSSHGRDPSNIGSGPRVELLSSREVVFDCVLGKETQQSVVFRNVSSVAVSYRWRKISLEKSDKDKKKRGASAASQADIFSRGQSFSTIINNKGEDSGRLRSHVLNANRDSFFCLRDHGDILPDEEVSTVFSFTSRAGPGVFRSDWILELTPFDTDIHLLSPAEAGNTSKIVGSVGIKLRGHCIEHDESQSKRRFISSFLSDRSTQSMAYDVVQDCLRRVRDPVRIGTLNDRRVGLFKSINAILLSSLSTRFGPNIALFVTPERLDIFVSAYKKGSELYDRVVRTLYTLREQDSGEINELEISNPFLLSVRTIADIRQQLFPERIIEIFDEITEDDLVAPWHYDVVKVVSVLSGLLSIVEEIDGLEKRIELRRIADEKARIKAEKKAARKARGDDSDEDEEEEEEEPEDDDDEKNRTKPVHPLLKETQSLIDSIQGTVNLLVARPVDASALYDVTRNHVSAMTENFNDWRAAALADAGILDMVTNGTAVPQLPSPFTSREGADAWANALKQTSAVAEPVAPVKGAPKPPKNAPPPTGPTTQQVDYFYKQLYTRIRSGILDMTEALFGDIDCAAVAEVEQMSTSGTLLTDSQLFDVAVPRASDVEAVVAETENQGVVSFVSFNGDAFTRTADVQSAFDIGTRNKLSAVQPVCRLLEQGCKAIVLLYDPTTTSQQNDPSQLDLCVVFSEIQSLVNKSREEYIAASDKQRKKMKLPPLKFKSVKYYASTSFAELNCQLDNLLRYGQMTVAPPSGNNNTSSDKSSKYFAANIPVILLQNVSRPSVVPSEPPFVDADSDDDDAPVPIGQDEFNAQKRAKWDAKRPHRVTVDVDTTGTGGKTIAVQCYADVTAATKELVSLAANQGDVVKWVDASAALTYTTVVHSAFGQLSPAVRDRLVSESIREACVWSGVVRSLPSAVSILSAASSTVGDDGVEAPVPPLTQHFRSLFPYSASKLTAPTSMAVIGGSIRSDKFRVIDQLLDKVSSIVIVGEMAIPFLALSSNVSFSMYTQLCGQYRAVCIQLLQKARLRSCPLTWPIDIVTGDEQVRSSDRMKCFAKVEPDARNEGAEYDGETKTVSLAAALAGNTTTDDFLLGSANGVSEDSPTAVKVEGYVYDIGPETCAGIKSAISAADLVLVWGTAGVCELSSFQAGQQAIVDAAATKVTEDAPQQTDTANMTKNPLRTVLMGDSCVEWFARFVDSDGELAGDLVAAGAVSYSMRDSTVLSGLLGHCTSDILSSSSLLLRLAGADEWVYSKRVAVVEEEEEEEEEEDED